MPGGQPALLIKRRDMRAENAVSLSFQPKALGRTIAEAVLWAQCRPLLLSKWFRNMVYRLVYRPKSSPLRCYVYISFSACLFDGMHQQSMEGGWDCFGLNLCFTTANTPLTNTGLPLNKDAGSNPVSRKNYRFWRIEMRMVYHLSDSLCRLFR